MPTAYGAAVAPTTSYGVATAPNALWDSVLDPGVAVLDGGDASHNQPRALDAGASATVIFDLFTMYGGTSASFGW